MNYWLEEGDINEKEEAKVKGKLKVRSFPTLP